MLVLEPEIRLARRARGRREPAQTRGRRSSAPKALALGDDHAEVLDGDLAGVTALRRVLLAEAADDDRRGVARRRGVRRLPLPVHVCAIRAVDPSAVRQPCPDIHDRLLVVRPRGGTPGMQHKRGSEPKSPAPSQYAIRAVQAHAAAAPVLVSDSLFNSGGLSPIHAPCPCLLPTAVG